jgi:SpoIVB peptidase S55
MTRLRAALAGLAAGSVALILILLSAPVTVSPIFATGTSEVPGPPIQQFMTIEAIRPGMEGTARTVFEGDDPEEFKVEILGVLRNAMGPQQDLILARLHGEKVEYTGVVSGMSGSPVYVEGKLIGALSYRLGSFAKEAIAGITPIADMLKLVGKEAIAGSSPAAAAPDLLGRFVAASAGTGESDPRAMAAAPAGLRPIGIPLVCSGCDPGVLQYYAPIFQPHGLEPTTGGGVVETSRPLPFVPGTPIGAALVTGSMSVVGIGTLTHVQNDRVFGFGHPLLGAGAVEIPMTQAQVLLTFPSAAASFKIANATPPIGAIVQDSLTAIVGQVGRIPPTLSLKVGVVSHAGRREFHYDIVRHRAWSPVLVALTTANSLVRTTEFEAAATLAVRYRIDLKGHPAVEVEDLYSGTNLAQPVHLALANDAGGLFNLLFNNRFEDPAVRSLALEVEMLQESQVATVTGLRASRPELRAGEAFTVTATLQPFRGEERSVVWEVALPEDTPPGETDLIVGSGPAIDGLERRTVERQLAQATDLDDLIRLVGRQRRSRDLYLRVTRRAPAAIVRSEILPDLPLSIFTVLNNPRLSGDSTLMSEAPVLEVARDVGVVAVGGRRISVKVK